MGFFDVKKTFTTLTEILLSQDQRVQVGGAAGTIVSPGAAVAGGGGGAIVTGPQSTIQQTIESTGATPAEVQSLLDSVFAAGAQERAAVTGLAGALAAGMQETTRSLSDVVAATRAPEQTALTSIMPLAALAVVLFFLWGGD